jgi:hypothetical protein
MASWNLPGHFNLRPKLHEYTKKTFLAILAPPSKALLGGAALYKKT